MAAADEYRGYAAECLRLAQEAKTDEDRARLLRMAQAWRDLAERFPERKT
jgi:hypothetical protein